VPRPVCGFSHDTCLQPPNCWGTLPDFHGTLAFHPQKRLGRFVEIHVTLAFSLQIAGADLLIFMGPWHSIPRSESAWASSNPCGGECRSSTLDIPYINSMACRNLHNGKPQPAEVWRERSLSEVSHMWYWRLYELRSLSFEEPHGLRLFVCL